MSQSHKTVIRFERRRNRSKRTARLHPDRPRLVVFRSMKNIEGQIIDDHQGQTLVVASSKEKELLPQVGKAKSKVEQSKIVGTVLAKRAQEKNIDQVVFDRNGYPYHGRIKAFAEAVREGGVKF